MSKFGTPTDEQLTKINKLAKRTLLAEEVFIFTGKSAGDMMIPNRYTKISPELLQIMVDDAKKGVSFMLNHNWSNWGGIQGVPYGKVFDGRIIDSLEEGESKALYLDKYIFRDDEVTDGISANSLIKKIESGILSDTSISFSTDIMKCSICGENYYGGKCRHWKGVKYEMGDGTQKTCTVTAMPPTTIIPYNNNALYEESIVWDGAYPGAVVSQSKHGDIIELPTGNFSILESKEELPENTLFLNKYHNGDLLTLVKKSEHKKLYNLGEIEKPKNEKLKGAEKSVNEKLKTMLTSFGWSAEEIQNLGVDETNNLLDKLAEKWDSVVESIQASAEPLSVEGPTLSEGDVVFPSKYMEKTFGRSLSGEQLEKFVKEGQEYHKTLSDEALSMGIRAMGNDFPKETWEQSFANMETKSIKDIMKTWEIQANVGIPAGRKTNPENPSISANSQALPDEAFRV